MAQLGRAEQNQLLDLLGSVWPFVARGIPRAQSWGGDWFEISSPHVLYDGPQMVAHTGVAWCDLWVDGAPRRVAALHGVCVRESHRGRGLGRQVLEQALDNLDRQGVETVILWSEKTALYAKFGFQPHRESAFTAPAPQPQDTRSHRLDLHESGHLQTLRNALQRRTPVSSRLAANDRGWCFCIDLALWTEVAGMPTTDLLLALPDQNAVMVCEKDGATLRIYDVIAEQLPTAAQLVGAAQQGKAIEMLELYFTPDRFDLETTPIPHPEEDVLMVRGQRLTDNRPFALSPLTRT